LLPESFFYDLKTFSYVYTFNDDRLVHDWKPKVAKNLVCQK